MWLDRDIHEQDTTQRADPGRVAEPVILCSQVDKRFGAVQALDNLTFAIPAGGVTGYLGPNGAGKTTTIRLLMDLARPTSGSIKVFGVDPRRAGPQLRGRIGYLPGELRLDERLTVQETLDSWIRFRGEAIDNGYIDDLCTRLNLDRSRRTMGLSSGNRRKLGLIGAFMAKPDLLILDEPTKGLDPLVQEEFFNLVNETREQGRSIFLSSHVLSEVQRIADRVLVIRSGRMVFSGAVQKLRDTAKHPFMVWFMGDPPIGELQALTSVTDLKVDGTRVSGKLEGSPDPLLKILAGGSVQRIFMPEPDLEEAFIHLYQQEDG